MSRFARRELSTGGANLTYTDRLGNRVATGVGAKTRISLRVTAPDQSEFGGV